MTDFAKAFRELAGEPGGRDLKANLIARSNGHEEWYIEGDKYSRERFRQLAVQAGRLLSPRSDDPLADWLRFVRDQPATETECRLAGMEYDDVDPEGTSVGIEFFSVYRVVVQASELAAGSLPRLAKEVSPEVALPDARGGKKPGRPPKGDPPGFTLVEAALLKHHGYQPGGSVTNDTPAKTTELAELSRKSDSTVSRYLKAKFGSYRKYEQACAGCVVGLKFAKWQGELSEDRIDSLIEESSRQRLLDQE